MANCTICMADTGSRKRSHPTPSACIEALDREIASLERSTAARLQAMRTWRDKLAAATGGDSIVLTVDRRTGETTRHIEKADGSVV